MAAVGQVSVLYDAKALLGEGPHYDEARDELVWVDIEGKTVNFLNLNTRNNSTIQLNARVGAAIPCEDDSNKLIAVIEREICVVDRESGQRRLHVTLNIVLLMCSRYSRIKLWFLSVYGLVLKSFIVYDVCDLLTVLSVEWSRVDKNHCTDISNLQSLSIWHNR